MEVQYANRSSLKRKRRRRQLWIRRIIALVVVIGIGFGLFFGVRAAYWGIRGLVDKDLGRETDAAESAGESLRETETEAPTEEPTVSHADVLLKAERMAQMYDYDGAIALLQEIPDYAVDPDLKAVVDTYKDARSKLVRIPTSEVYHIFYHSLIVDPAKAFGCYKADGYNRNMVTVDEFNKINQQLYDNGFVLVSLHDVAHMDENGKFIEGNIRLPEGKKAMVLSIDDVQYYEYMTGHGFATKVVKGENGKVTSEMKLDNGSVVYGSFDVMPLIDDFVELHPDYSYKGAKGTLALTGYDGIMGYRTSYKYGDPSSSDWKDWYATLDLEEERRQAAEVAAYMRENGWEFASHSWGHINMTDCGLETIKNDTEMWLKEVAPLIGGTDLLIFPFGADIGSWRNYEADNAKFQYLKSVGFNFYCNVDGYTIPWDQYNGTLGYLRQGRVNIDGVVLLSRPEVLTEKFGIDLEGVIEPLRPSLN